jgi:hypothetical protein
MWMATMWSNNAVMYVTVPYNKVLFSILYFLTGQSEVDFGIAHTLSYICTSPIKTSYMKCFENDADFIYAAAVQKYKAWS